MKSFFQKFKFKKQAISSRDEKLIAQTGSVSQRLKLAKNEQTSPEILYYLAEHDGEVKVRQAVVKNNAIPIHASGVLARDTDIGVRELLLARLTKLLPKTTPKSQANIYKHISEALGVLALDEVLKIRIALSAALKNYAHTPPQLAAQLARDVERQVSEPILRYSLALPDEDLIDILQNYKQSWQVQAVALRESLSASVSRAVIETRDTEAGVLLLSNASADVSPETFINIVEHAKEQSEWQKPLAMRQNLPPEIAREMAGYIDHSIKDVLFRYQEFDTETIDEITRAVERGMALLENQESNMSVAERIGQHKINGTLNNEIIQTAMGVGDTEFVEAALASLASISVKKVKKIIKLHTARPFTALCWKAGLSMRTALMLQRELVKIPQGELLHPKGGMDYPMNKSEIQWQLEFLGIE